MPTQLQARLLRVLQERCVNPLGSGKEYEVDVAIVCATHRDLKGAIARGSFREDLYYRLNGMVVKLPALRDRTDFDIVVRKVLDSLCEDGAVPVSPMTCSRCSGAITGRATSASCTMCCAPRSRWSATKP